METVSKRRKPLSDRTNTIASANNSSVSSSSSPFVKPTKPHPSVPVSSVFKKLLKDIKNDTSNKRDDNSNRINGSSNPSEPTSSLPPPHTPVPIRPLKSTSASGTGKHDDSEPCTVYTRRKSAHTTRSRGKEIAKPIFSPGAKTEYKRDKMNKVRNTRASKSCTVPPPFRKKPRGILSKQDNSNHALPEDFIEQQREYFAEIDAFELLEEEVKLDDDLT
ncbi:hypothetical protein HS088_TW01G00526 [Tripterygium wilfordii]|uniref:Uncharacterized protein n=1 Tax=Tripterygium wilfordii TaxID=458696 RepID=A0A7J7E248_TRIWF|nr:uncharacterized protein LOC120001578 isoform X3 [Tripterygium wilfordii]KAF5752611.1 hypothetical protein HS088_TW01G00526 [Tripterygium wilfordii]